MDGKKFCYKCGAEIFKEAEICVKCGVRQPDFETNKNQSGGKGKDKVMAGLLAILLGGLGVHKFYLGQSGSGIIRLLFCWTGIPLIVGVIEGLILFSISDQEFNRKYN